MTYDDLKAIQQDLLLKIDVASRNRQTDEVTKLKRSLYENKIKMIDAIDEEDRQSRLMTGWELKQEVESMPIPPRYETGIPQLDFKLRDGIEVGTFVQLSGESGAGKTTLVLAILRNVVTYSKCVFFNFEMGKRRIHGRLKKLFTSDQQWKNLRTTIEGRHIDDLVNEIKLASRDGVKFFMIDSMMKIDSSVDNELQAQAEISHKLSRLAQEKEIIIILINQQSEDAIQNKRLSLKGSNSQKYDADLLFFLVIEDDKRKIICGKNRQDEYLFTVDIELSDVKSDIKPTETEIAYQVETVSAPVI